MRIREVPVEEQIQWVLIYVQRESIDIWKKNVLEFRELEFSLVGDFLAELRKEFGKEDNKLAKVAELRKIEQELRTMEKFMQEFQKVARESGYKGKHLNKEFKIVLSGKSLWKWNDLLNVLNNNINM